MKREKQSKKINILYMTKLKLWDISICAQIFIPPHLGFFSTLTHLFSASSRLLFLVIIPIAPNMLFSVYPKKKKRNFKKYFFFSFSQQNSPEVLSMPTVSNFLSVLSFFHHCSKDFTFKFLSFSPPLFIRCRYRIAPL